MRANGFGAHQLTRPSTCMNAGTSSIRTSVVGQHRHRRPRLRPTMSRPRRGSAAKQRRAAITAIAAVAHQHCIAAAGEQRGSSTVYT